MKNLGYLYLASRNIVKVPKTLVQCKRLKTLFLDRLKKDAEIPIEIFKIPSLERLQLPLGYSEKLPTEIREMFIFEKIIDRESFYPIHSIIGREILLRKT